MNTIDLNHKLLVNNIIYYYVILLRVKFEKNVYYVKVLNLYFNY